MIKVAICVKTNMIIQETDLVDVNQDISLTDHLVLNVVLIVLNVIMNQYVHNVTMDMLTFTKEVVDVQMGSGTTVHHAQNVEATVCNAETAQAAIYAKTLMET